MRKTYKYTTDDVPGYKYPIFWAAAIPVVALIICSCFWSQGNDNAVIMPTTTRYHMAKPAPASYSKKRLAETAKQLGTKPASRLPGSLNKMKDEDGKVIYSYQAKGLPELVRVDDPAQNTTAVYIYSLKSKYGNCGKQLYQGKIAQ